MMAILINMTQISLSFAESNEKKIESRALKAISCLRPDYPARALSARQEGNVDILVSVNEKGKVTGTEVLKSSGYPKLDEKAEYGFKHCKFLPEIQNGVAVNSQTTLTFHWRLPESIY